LIVKSRMKDNDDFFGKIIEKDKIRGTYESFS
jgi:hypothetical protein